MEISDKKLSDLLHNGESQNVDFKLYCNAFTSGNSQKQPRFELIKDICAFANNGNVISYMIIGVSNDRTEFKSVNNNNLNEEILQNYVRENIHPPPRIHVYRKKIKAKKTYELVIIQIGPNIRQAYRLSQDLICYPENVCFRKNEVWIRQGPICVLATPEEISRLVNGKEPIETATDRKNEREEFDKLPQNEKCKEINIILPNLLKKFGYKPIPGKFCSSYPSYYGNSSPERFFWKGNETVISIINISRCVDNFSIGDPIFTRMQYALETLFDDLPLEEYLKNRCNFSKIKRLQIVPILASVPRIRIQKFYRSWNWTAHSLYFISPTPDTNVRGLAKKTYKLSTEIIFIDKILSKSDFCEKFADEIEFFYSYNQQQDMLP